MRAAKDDDAGLLPWRRPGQHPPFWGQPPGAIDDKARAHAMFAKPRKAHPAI
jgi:hypothetical protein